MLKTVYNKYGAVLEDLTAIYADDVRNSCMKGLFQLMGVCMYFMAHMGLKADLPMLQKMGTFQAALVSCAPTGFLKKSLLIPSATEAIATKVMNVAITFMYQAGF